MAYNNSAPSREQLAQGHPDSFLDKVGIWTWAFHNLVQYLNNYTTLALHLLNTSLYNVSQYMFHIKGEIDRK